VDAQVTPDVEGRDIPSKIKTRAQTPGSFNRALDWLDRQRYSPDLREVLLAINTSEAFMKNVSVAIDNMHDRAFALMKEKKVEVEGIGVVERATSTNTKWDNEALFQALAKFVAVAVDPSTGEPTIDGLEFAKLLRDTAAVAYWRKGKLEALGLNPDEYSETNYGKRRVRQRSQEGRR
jgi:hypothetical protein